MLILFLVVGLVSPVHAEPPQRVVSINLCTDELVMPLADIGTVKSVSYFAADPAESPIAEDVRGIPVNYARAEEILPLKPDIVFADVFSASYTVGLLRRLGVNVVEIPTPTDFKGIRANIRRVARILGHPERGEALISAFDRTLAETKDSEAGPKPLSVIYRAGGYTDGGMGLISDILAHVGLRNLALEQGIPRWGHLSVEQLLLGKPDLVIFSSYEREAPSLEAAILEHPAIRSYLTTHHAIGVPAKYWGCATPQIAEVAKRLADIAQKAGAR
jgi:iron complex transport system substrate-binding protein